MQASYTLQLVQASAQLNNVITRHVAQQLQQRGYVAITPPLLAFLSVLECGVNYASEIARNLGVTRQMVAKTVKELSGLGYLTVQDGQGKQKQILFTVTGENLIAEAREVLADLDEVFEARLSHKKIQKLLQQLSECELGVQEQK